MSQEVLVLNSDYEPLNVCNLRRALLLVYSEKADILHSREDAQGRPLELRTVSGDRYPVPSVVLLRYHVRRPLPELKLSRRSVFARDNYTCQYCGTVGKDLTIDHVTPKRYGGPMTWENLVTCCRRCNTKKGDKPMDKVGMRLARAPRRPRYTPYISLNKYVAGTRHDVWKDYLPVYSDISGVNVAAMSGY